jgi:hypothetical protein
MKSLRTGILCVAIGSLAGGGLAQQGLGAIRNHFDSDATMREPAFFDFTVLGAPGAAEWIVTSEQNPPSAPNDVTQTVRDRPADSIAAALRRNVHFQDGRLSIIAKRGPARGGMVFRVASEKDFLVLLIDLSSGDARLLSYRDGKPSELASGKAALTMDWGTLTVELKGPDIRAAWQGKPLLSAVDPAPVAGRAGMATAGPGLVTFDEFLIVPANEAAKF